MFDVCCCVLFYHPDLLFSYFSLTFVSFYYCCCSPHVLLILTIYSQFCHFCLSLPLLFLSSILTFSNSLNFVSFYYFCFPQVLNLTIFLHSVNFVSFYYYCCLGEPEREDPRGERADECGAHLCHRRLHQRGRHVPRVPLGQPRAYAGSRAGNGGGGGGVGCW